VYLLGRGEQVGQVDAAGGGRERSHQAGSPLQQRTGAGGVSTLQVQETDPDLQDSLVEITKVGPLVEPEVLKGFMAGEVLAGIELPDSCC